MYEKDTLLPLLPTVHSKKESESYYKAKKKKCATSPPKKKIMAQLDDHNPAPPSLLHRHPVPVKMIASLARERGWCKVGL